jgi:hypothetical protein
MAALSDKARSAKAQIEALPKDEQQVVVAQLNEALFPSTDKYRLVVWLVLLIDAFAVAIVALILAARLSDTKDPAAYIAVASAAVAGVLGLFAKSPVT